MVVGLIRAGVRLWRARCGTASVELVFILPVLTIILFGTIEIGRLLFDYHAVSKSVRDATRYLSRADATALGLDLANCTVNAGSTPAQETRNLALRGTTDGSASLLLPYWSDPGNVTITVRCVDNSADPPPYQGFYSNVNQIAVLTVNAEVNFPLMNGWLLGRGNTLTFNFSHEEAHFGE